MKKLALLAISFFVMNPVSAREISSVIVDSVQLTVDGPALQTSRVGGQYSVSGSNVSVTSLGGWNGDANGANAPSMSAGSYAINDYGAAFNFTESIFFGDSSSQSQNSLTTEGRVDGPRLYSESTQYQGGTAGNLAGTLTTTGAPSVTAGGPGTTVIGQRSVELSVFR